MNHIFKITVCVEPGSMFVPWDLFDALMDYTGKKGVNYYAKNFYQGDNEGVITIDKKPEYNDEPDGDSKESI